MKKSKYKLYRNIGIVTLIIIGIVLSANYLKINAVSGTDVTGYKNVQITNDKITYSGVITSYNSGYLNTYNIFKQYGGNLDNFIPFYFNLQLIPFYLENALNIDSNNYVILAGDGDAFPYGCHLRPDTAKVNLSDVAILESDGWTYDATYNCFKKLSPTDSKMVELTNKMYCYASGTFMDGTSYKVKGNVEWDGMFICKVTSQSKQIKTGIVEFSINTCNCPEPIFVRYNCLDSQLFEEYNEYQCVNGLCDENTIGYLVKDCENGCSNGKCNVPPTPNIFYMVIPIIIIMVIILVVRRKKWLKYLTNK